MEWPRQKFFHEFLAGLAAFLLISVTQNSQSRPYFYSITDLGTLGGGQSSAAGINNQGEVVGTADLLSTNITSSHAFLYTGGNMKDLGVLGEYTNSIGTVSSSSGAGINNHEQIVGFSYTTKGTIHAFLYGEGQMTDLGALVGTQQSKARGINDSGQVVGWSLPSAPEHAFFYDNGGVTDLGTLGGTESFAYAINNHGLIVGDSWQTNSGLSDRAFFYTNGTMTFLGNLGSWPAIQATAVNDEGQIVGYAGTVNTGSPSVTHGFVYTAGAMTDLGNLGGAITNVLPSSINNKGEIVGTAEGYQGPLRPFFWSGGVMSDLNSLIDPSSGWTLQNATGINDNGQIVGNGKSPSQHTHAFLLTPRPSLQNLRLSGTQCTLNLLGMTGVTYRVDYSPSLETSNWLTLTNLIMTTSPCEIRDGVAALSGQRFYRAVQVP